MGIPGIDKTTHYMDTNKLGNTTFQIKREPSKEHKKLQPINFNSGESNITMGRTTFPSEQLSYDGADYTQSSFSKRA